MARKEIIVRIEWPNIPLESLCAEIKSVLIGKDFNIESVESGETESIAKALSGITTTN